MFTIRFRAAEAPCLAQCHGHSPGHRNGALVGSYTYEPYQLEHVNASSKRWHRLDALPPPPRWHVSVVLLPMFREHSAWGTIAGRFFARRAFATPSAPVMPYTLLRRLNTAVGHSHPPLGTAALRMRGADRLSGLVPGLAVSAILAPTPAVPMPTTWSLSF